MAMPILVHQGCDYTLFANISIHCRPRPSCAGSTGQTDRFTTRQQSNHQAGNIIWRRQDTQSDCAINALRGALPRSALTAYLGRIVVPAPGDVDIVGVVGSDLDPANGVYHEADDIRTYTLWGELAYQLWRAQGLPQTRRKSDVERAAPGTWPVCADHWRSTHLDHDRRNRAPPACGRGNAETASRQSDLASQTVAFHVAHGVCRQPDARGACLDKLAAKTMPFSAERRRCADIARLRPPGERAFDFHRKNEISAIVASPVQRVDHDAVQWIVDIAAVRVTTRKCAPRTP